MGWKCNTYLRLKARQVLVMVCRRNRGCSQERRGQMTQFGPAAERCKWHLSTVPARERDCQEMEGKTKKHGRLQSVTLRPKALEENLFFLFSPQRFLVPSVKTGVRTDSRLLRPIQWAGLELSRIRWRSPPGFMTSRGGRGLTGYKETGGTTSATCWWTATVGTLQPISGVKSVWRRSALLWVTTVMSSVRPEQTFSCFSSCWRLLLLRNIILWYCQYMICCCRFFF